MLPEGTVFPFSVLICILISGLFFVYWSQMRAKAGKKMIGIRKIAAIDAIEEGVGRCTEMGKPLLVMGGIYSPISSEWAPHILASFSICRYAATLAVKNDVPIIWCSQHSDHIPLIDENLREAYSSEGKMELYDPDYSLRMAGTVGGGAGTSFCVINAYLCELLQRDLPGCTLMLIINCHVFSTTLELAARQGAFQIASDFRVLGLPFAVIASDYFMIGEEVFAAEAYLSKDPSKLGSIAGQDVIKILVMVILVVGSVMLSFGNKLLADLLKA